MKTLVFDAARHMEMQQVDDPVPSYGEVLIKVQAAGICGSEVNGYTGRSARHVPPLVLGHEFAGIVAGFGAGVEDLKVGQQVVVNPLLPCGECDACLSGNVNACFHRQLIGVDLPGGFAEYAVVPRSAVYRLPDGMTPLMGAMVEPLANTVHVFQSYAPGLVKGVAIIGAGTQGLLALQLSGLVGISPRIIVDIQPERLEVARGLGAERVVNAREEDPVDVVAQMTDGRGLDMVIDAVGSTVTRQQSIRMVRWGGLVVLLGMHDAQSELDMWVVVARGLTLQGTVMYTRHDFQRSIDLLASQRIETESWIEQMPLEEGYNAFETLVSDPGKMVKVVLRP